MNCRHWPPFYEQYINGQCVKVPPPKVESKYEYLGVIGVLLAVFIPIYLITRATSK